MKNILLSKGKIAIIDEKDFKVVNKSKWCLSSTGYAITHIKGSGKNGKNMFMHRLIMGFPLGMVVDHINGNVLDNRRENLRICSHRENIRNQKIQNIVKTSVYKGVHWRKDIRKWSAKIQVNGKQLVIGIFKEEQHAAMAYDIWAKENFGEFAKLNFTSLCKKQ